MCARDRHLDKTRSWQQLLAAFVLIGSVKYLKMITVTITNVMYLDTMSITASRRDYPNMATVLLNICRSYDMLYIRFCSIS